MRPTIVHRDAPAERLAALRIVTGMFAVVYLALRLPVFLELRDRSPSDLQPVGVLRWLDSPLGDDVLTVLVIVAFMSGLAYCAGTSFQIAGPVFGLTMLVLTTYRSSWGQLLHFENLMVLHLLIVGVAASADAWSFDARRSEARSTGARQLERPVSVGSEPGRGKASHDYSSPLRLCCVVVVVSYVIAGFAKLRYGGVDWVVGDTLRNHIAYSAARLELLGGTPSPLAAVAVERAWMFRPMAAAAVVIELVAPIALFGGWYRNVWVGAAWVMHAAIAALMLVAFPYPLFLAAFVPFFPLERVRIPGNLGRSGFGKRTRSDPDRLGMSTDG